MVGAFWSAVSTYGNVILSFLVFLVLARLLSPDEFGIVAIASVFVDIILIVSRGGLPEAVIQRPVLEEEFADTAFWLSTGGGLVFAVLLALAAPGIAQLFSMPDLAPVLMVLALVLAFGGVGAVHEARLQRTFAFKQLAMRALVANLVAGAISVLLAFQGWGVWAMVAQRVLASAATAVLNWVTLGWIPKIRFVGSFARDQWGFGSRIFGANLLIGINVRLQELIAAAFLSPAAVGYIRLSWRCIDLVSQIAVIPLGAVAMASYARIKAEGGRIDDAYLGFIRFSAVLAFPCFLGMAAVAPVMIPVAFGAKWDAAVPVLQILCLTAVPFVASSFMWPLMAALKRADRNLQISFVQVVAGTALSLAAAPFGLYAVTLSHLLRTYLVWPMTLTIMRKDAGIETRRIFAALGPPLGLSLAMAVVVYGLNLAISEQMADAAKLALLVAVGGVVYVGGSLAFMPEITRSIVGEAKRLLSKKAQ